MPVFVGGRIRGIGKRGKSRKSLAKRKAAKNSLWSKYHIKKSDLADIKHIIPIFT